MRLEERTVETLVPGEAEAWITLPALDEEDGIGPTLAALQAQTLRPLVVCIVDNGSRDGTVDRVRAWAASLASSPAAAGLGVRLVAEPEKGTGAAADTGMRIAAAAGARYLLRTDADSLPRPRWAARMVERLSTDADLVAGRMVDRADEGNGLGRRVTLWLLVAIAAGVSVPKNRGRGYRTRFRMMMGSNVGIRAETYLAAGGFPRSRIEEVHDDRVLMNRTRRVTDRIASDRHAVVASSSRRYRRYGLRGVIAWYLHHDSRGEPVDVR
ncbi:MAG TPA: glycosyltransferase family A protein [Candidatus Limnocylindrales bacterium]|jgi:glycosyltransferase involved in cell wall biosynthesis|nr:glycosyltransferase family A protein [Candidatus Limnocylindrales bacterium]